MQININNSVISFCRRTQGHEVDLRLIIPVKARLVDLRLIITVKGRLVDLRLIIPVKG